jgi:asparagine synthase (glutamine-hydrolysing)
MYGVAFKENSNIACAGCKPVSPWVSLGGNGLFENERLAAVSDADIYNFNELSQLVDKRPRNDAHLMALLYFRFGEAAFKKICGRFSVCIVDKKKQRLVVAADRFGINPVVYSCDGKHFIFGPGIRTIQALFKGQRNDIDYEALVDYINLSAIPTPKTIFRQMRKLPPGHFLVVSKGEVIPELSAYYDIDYTRNNAGEDYFRKSLAESIESSVKAVVDYETDKGRRIGAFLSGGTDSSTVTGMIKKVSGSVKTFSIGFDEPGYNELDYARVTARHFGAEHHEYMVTPDDVLKSLDSVLDAFDEPFGNASAVPTYYCALLAKEHGVDTLLAGDGGDEIFGGNERYAAGRIFTAYHRLPVSLRKMIIEPLVSAAPAVLPGSVKGKKYIRRANIPQPDRFLSYNPVSALGQKTIFSPEVLGSVNGYDPVAWARELYDTARAEDELNKLLYIDMKFTITDNDLRKVTAASEKAGLRVAYPLLDHRLVDLAATMPVSLKVRGKALRYMFKKALSAFLPPEIIAKKKHGFGLPIGVWIRTKKNIAGFVQDALRGPDCTIAPYFRDGFIDELFSRHRETGAAFYGDIIWNLLVLELWNKRRLVE